MKTLTESDVAQLKEKADQLRRELFSVKLKAQTGHLKGHNQFKELKKNIARVLTVLKEKEQSVRN